MAALVISSAAICAMAQDGRAVKQNKREPETSVPAQTTASGKESPGAVRYSYEFKQPEFSVRRIVIEHDAEGRGTISFERKGDDQAMVEPFALSAKANGRIRALWDALKFLDSEASYQSEKQYPHLGTVRLRMQRGERERVAEFNWADDPNAKALASEYWRAADQAILVFDLMVSRENLPLESPKLLDRLDSLLRRGELSDPDQLVPLLRDLSTDERIPLMARNHASRLLKKIEK